MEELMLKEFAKEHSHIDAIDHNGNYDYRYIEFLYDQIKAFETSFESALRIIDHLKR